ncbi:hypothetical protein [Planomonospora sp. ID82291]|uniref:hypothetical protein n=1 Tax=Planomonospora sp. ID82291 TaxID=2738136 RepID=UPI0018C42AE6|nr:hypothetical protein [Planomonospora sp. ID82291]MBG0819036.1 hypothetical protein [Planomonospora sp. ID82291]
MPLLGWPGWAWAAFAGIAGVSVGAVIYSCVSVARLNRAERRRVVARAEQVLAWEAGGYPRLPYVTIWHRGTGYELRRTPGYWPEVSEQAAADSQDRRYDRVTVRLRTPVADGYVTEWTWQDGALISEERHQPGRAS